jgi:P-type Ca2+ transporter type 2C
VEDAASSTIFGLSNGEAAARLRVEGPNELPQAKRRTPLRIAAEVMREPMFALLIGAGIIYLLLGDLGEALILLLFASLSVAITIVQEARGERVLEALRDLSSPRALVIREGDRKRIPGRELVSDDILVIAEGDRVAADAQLLSAHDLQADESLLTGESVPVRKLATTVGEKRARPGGDDLPFVYSGTMIVRGYGLAKVYATGARSEIGKIGVALKTIETEPPILRQQTQRIVRIVAVLGLSVSALVMVLYGLWRGSWLDALLAGIALSMSMLPEEFPLVLTVFMVMGAWRISRARVLTRRAAAIESLGSATVLCTDKTGTLTQNRMKVAELYAGGEGLAIAEAANNAIEQRYVTLAEYANLASARGPHDPMEGAIRELNTKMPPTVQSDRTDWTLVRTYGLRPDLLAMTQVWRRPGVAMSIVAAKGAPEAIADLCRLCPSDSVAVRRAADDMAQRGMRVLGVARATRGENLPETQRDFVFELLGLVALADPLRDSVPAAVRECRAAGIRVVMVTGDYPATARAIAASAGIDTRLVISGEEFARMNDAQLAEKARDCSVFARIMPEQKLRIVEALKAAGEIVAMTGDGVNDAPSLKAAHIGVAMGGRGTDVAREAAAIVLLDDDFGSIVRTIRLGRRIYDNLRKAMGYVLAMHVPIAGLSLLPLLFGSALILMPIHIAFLEMVIDPVCSIAFEAEEAESNVMARPPRDPKSPLFSRALVGWSLLQGLFAFLLVAGIYWVACWRGLPEPETRALAFVSLVFTNVALIFVNRAFSASLLQALRRPNAPLWWILATTAILLGISLLWPPARALFRFGPLHLDDLTVCVSAGIATIAGLDLLKSIWRRQLPS